MNGPWTDHAGGSIHTNGCKVGEFPSNGRYEWWAYPPNWTPRGTVEALGPFNSRAEAKDAITSWLGME